MAVCPFLSSVHKLKLTRAAAVQRFQGHPSTLKQRDACPLPFLFCSFNGMTNDADTSASSGQEFLANTAFTVAHMGDEQIKTRTFPMRVAWRGKPQNGSLPFCMEQELF